MTVRLPTAWFCCFLLFCGVSRAEDSVLFLKNGDRVSGKIVSDAEGQLQVDSGLLGMLTIGRDAIDHVSGKPDASPPAPPPPSSSPTVLASTLSVSYSMANGNRHGRDAAVSLTQRYAKGLNTWAMNTEWIYGADSRKMTTQKFFSKAQNDRSFPEHPRWFLTRAMEVSHDRFNNVNLRLIPSAGYGYRFWDNAGSTAALDMALGYEYTDYREDTRSRGVWILVPHGFIKGTLPAGGVWSQDLTFYPSLQGSGDYRLRSVSSLVYPINKALSWKLTLTDEFNAAPAGQAKKNDSLLMAALDYAF